MSHASPDPKIDLVNDLLHVETRERADARLLVLTSQGIHATVLRTQDGFQLSIEREEDVERARDTLALWIIENRPRKRLPERELSNLNRGGDLAIAYAMALSLLAVHLGLQEFGEASLARRIGSANAYDIVRGEIGRTLTALTLHSDLPHALSNTLFGGLFLASLSGRVGAGVALAGALASGALGNLANAIHHQTGHNSIGASTAVFGVVGLLCGIEAWRRQRLALPWQGAWVPIGAGAALLAMLGAGGGDVDYGAHIYGLLAGIGLGWLTAPRWRTGPPRAAIQALYGGASLLLLGLAWLLAVQRAGAS